MSELFAFIPNIGEMYYYHTYLFYDEPQLFSCITKTQQLYFISTIPNDSADNSWIAVPISTGKLTLLEKNAIEIKDAFTNPESILWRIDYQDQKYNSFLCDHESLTQELLPESGELLDYSAGQELSPSTDAPIKQAQREMRDVIELSLEKEDQHISELPCAALSEVLENIQQLVYAIGYKDGGLSGPIPNRIRENNTLSVTGMFAASVGIRLKSNYLSNLFGETPFTKSLVDLNLLFNCMEDKQAIREYITTHNPRVAIKYRRFLKSLVRYNIGFKINNASPNNNSYCKRFSTRQLVASLSLINSEIKEIVENKILYGTIVGINVENDTFMFITTDKERIRGNLSDAIKGSVFAVPQVVEASVEIRIGTDSFTQEEKLVYTLMSINPIVNENMN